MSNGFEIVEGIVSDLVGVPAFLGMLIGMLPTWVSVAIGFAVVLMFLAIILNLLT